MKVLVVHAAGERRDGICKAVSDRGQTCGTPVELLIAGSVTEARRLMELHPGIKAAVIDGPVPAEPGNSCEPTSLMTFAISRDLTHRGVLTVNCCAHPDSSGRLKPMCKHTTTDPFRISHLIIPAL